VRARLDGPVRLVNLDEWATEPFRLIQNRGTGMAITGTRDWRDYTVTADVTPHLATAAGLAARVQGLHRFYALELLDNRIVRLIRGPDDILAVRPFAWQFGQTYQLRLDVDGDHLRAGIDGDPLFDVRDNRYECGGIGLRVTQGRTATGIVRVDPLGTLGTS